jgi:hypothetical protein
VVIEALLSSAMTVPSLKSVFQTARCPSEVHLTVYGSDDHINLMRYLQAVEILKDEQAQRETECLQLIHQREAYLECIQRVSLDVSNKSVDIVSIASSHVVQKNFAY